MYSISKRAGDPKTGSGTSVYMPVDRLALPVELE